MTNQTPLAKATNPASLLLSLPENPTPSLAADAVQDLFTAILKAMEDTATPDNSTSSSSSKKTGPAKPAASAAGSNPDPAAVINPQAAPPPPLLDPIPRAISHAPTRAAVQPEISATAASPSSMRRDQPDTSPVASSAPAKAAARTETAVASETKKETKTSVPTPASLQAASAKPGIPLVPAEKTDPASSATALVAAAVSQGAAPVLPKSPTSGTSVAQRNGRMTLTAERNEIAGRTEKKVPSDAVSAIAPAAAASSSGGSSKGGAKLSLDFTWRDTPSQTLPIMDAATKTPLAVPAAETATAVPAGHLQRVEQLISQQAVNIRQTGANSLGVSLQLDEQTRISVQLTHANGQVQATVRCESGAFSPQDAQWSQLQQSLARQNIQLTPASGTSAQFGSFSGNSSRSFAAQPEEAAPSAFAVTPARQRQQKNSPNRSRQGWESWA